VLGFNLEDGNADKETEELIPSPNFCVLVNLFEGALDSANFFILMLYVSKSHGILMSSLKPLTLARLSDNTLGSFAFVPSSKTLEHLVRYLATWNGSELRFTFRHCVTMVSDTESM
jgi:hypothetical protein